MSELDLAECAALIGITNNPSIYDPYINPEKNKQRGFERIISSDKSKVPIIVIPTDEEYMIARDTYNIVHNRSQIVPASHYGTK